VRDLQAWYGESHILHGVYFDVAQGEVVTLLGRNGAGKTTTLKAIMGVVPKREGSILFENQQTVNPGVEPHRATGVSPGVPRERGIFELSVEENSVLPPGAGRRPAVEQIYRANFPTSPSGASQGTKLSGGEQQMLAIGRILRTRAHLLPLDEADRGFSPVIVQTDSAVRSSS
jgi:branched-chain amino acid transport system ATP-binding protein